MKPYTTILWRRDMTEENKLSDLQKVFIDKKNKEIEFVKNVADVRTVNAWEGDGKKIVGLDEDKQRFFDNGDELRKYQDLCDFCDEDDNLKCNFLCYKHKDGTEIFNQEVTSRTVYGLNTLFVKGQDYVFFHGRRTIELHDLGDETIENSFVSIGKLNREDVDASLDFAGSDILSSLKSHNPDLYDLYNKYIPQDVDTSKIISKLTDMKHDLDSLQQNKNKADTKISDSVLIKEALNKWNSGR